MDTFTYENKTYHCPFEFALDLVSGKWKGLVLWHLSGGTMRYGELKKSLPGITQKMLTQTLRDLEKYGLIDRKVYPVVPPKVEYTLTKDGEMLGPIFKQLHGFGQMMGDKLGVEGSMCCTHEPPVCQGQEGNAEGSGKR